MRYHVVILLAGVLCRVNVRPLTADAAVGLGLALLSLGETGEIVAA